MLAIVLFLWIVIAIQSPDNCDRRLDEVVKRAFQSTHDGFSSDEVLLNDKLNGRFLARCREELPQANDVDFNWTLINLRKAGKLSGIETTRRRRVATGDVLVLAEVVTRSMLDRTKVSVDRLLADPPTRRQFDELARSYDPDVELYAVRKAAFQLRKSRRLRPELITRIADWGRQIQHFSLREFAADATIAPELPGVYIFHDRSGYLYVGQSDNLRRRLSQHLEDSSNFALEKYLKREPRPEDQTFVEIHSFPADSRGRELVVRRAYESELIRSRNPRFNILP